MKPTRSAEHHPERPGRLSAGLTRLVAFGAVCAAIFVAATFVWFVTSIADDETRLDVDADGIVVLTGGSSRIADAVELLALRRGQRLLISGVHPATSQREIVRLMPDYRQVIDCCVDLDRSALNTVGNAIETRRWTEKRGFKSLIVVTSNYHMPRAMAELAHQLPDVRLIPFAVVTHKRDALWSSEPTIRLLFSEYLKYMLALARMRFEPAS